MSTVLISGSNGFIGHHVATYFAGRGWTVLGLGRKSIAATPEYVMQYISCVLGEYDTLVKLKQMISDKNIDVIVHLAADMRKEPYATDVIRANCIGTQQLLELAHDFGIPVMLQLSSLPVIGTPCIHPIMENHPLRPQTVYHITKCMNELQLQYAAQHYGMRTAWLRISAPLGIGMNEHTIFPTFVKNALVGKPLCLYGNGSRQQDYIYVKDIAKALYLAAINPSVRGCYNLTGGDELLISNKELAATCIRVLNSNSSIEYVDALDPSDNEIWDASIERAVNDFGFQPCATLEDVILEYANALQKEEVNL